MAFAELGRPQEMEEWAPLAQRPLAARMLSGLWSFTRKKPLGAFCAVVIVIFIILGDLVPEAINQLSATAGLANEPVPYLADALAENLEFIHPYERQSLLHTLEDPSSEFLLGTDSYGRDILSRLLYGARTAVIVSFGAVLISTIIQILISVPAGYYGGWYDKIMYRFVDIADALPSLVILIVVLGILGGGLWEMVLAMGVLFGFGGRYIRGQTISLTASPYVEGAHVIGASNFRIMTRYILPNLMPLILLGATLRLGYILLLEASLSFLGFGLPPPFPSWGQMLSLEGRQFMRLQPGLAIYPGLAIALLVFSFNLLGDALRDVLDPRLRGSR